MTQIEWSTRSTSAFNVFFVLFVRIYYLYMYILLCNKLEICSVAIGNWVAPVSDDISCIIEQQRIARWKNVWEYFLRVVNVICCMLGKNIRAQLYLKRIVTMANWWIWRESDALSKASVVRSATICFAAVAMDMQFLVINQLPPYVCWFSGALHIDEPITHRSLVPVPVCRSRCASIMRLQNGIQVTTSLNTIMERGEWSHYIYWKKFSI